jgi:alpha-tubulin suppressor-like RCC1 family protein
MSLNTNSLIEANVLNENNLNEINGSVVGDILIKMNNNNNNNNNNLFFQSGISINRDTGLCISSSNNVGFGTTNVKEKIDVSGGIMTDNYKLPSVTIPIIDISSNIKTSGYMNISKGLSINNNKFIVDISGNTKMLGNLDVSSNLNLNNVFGISSNGNFTTTGKLDISGSLNINNNFTVSNTGDALIKGLLDVTNKTTFNSDVSLNNGILDVGSNHVLYIDNLNNRVGIGVIPDATYNFYVKGNTKIRGDLVINGTTSIQDTSSNTVTSFDLTNNGTGPAIVVNQQGVQPVATFTDDNKPVLYIANNGLTGVGKVDPSYNLDISGTALVKQNLNVNNGLMLSKPLVLSFKISQVATSGTTSYFIRESDGVVFGVGSGDLGNIPGATGLINNRTAIPVQVPGIVGITQISSGLNDQESINYNSGSTIKACTLFLRGSDGAVFGSGLNEGGQLGIVTQSTFEFNLKQVKGVDGVGFITGITQIAGGSSHSLFLRDGAVFSCGLNGYGQLGINSNLYQSRSLKQVTGVNGVEFLNGITQITTSVDHSLFLRGSDGAVFSCGCNTKGALGNGTNTNSFAPVQVQGVNGVGFITGITQIAVGEHSLFLRGSDGAVFGCGMNGYGQLGINNFDIYYTTLQQVKGVNGVGFITGITQIACGYHHSLFLRGSDGAVFVTGGGYYSSQLGLGLGKYNYIQSLQQVKGVNGVGYITGITKIVAKNYVSLFLKADGSIFSCGINHFGQLGVGYYTSDIHVGISTLQQVVDNTGVTPSLVATGTNTVPVTLNNHSVVNNRVDISQGIVVNDKLKVDASGNLDTSGNVNVAGTVTIYGNVSQSGTFNQDGDIDVSGNTLIKNNLDISRNLRVNADKFMVDPSSGNILSKGTMDISGYFNVNNKFKIDSTGNITSSGALDISKNFSINQSNLVIDLSGNVKSKGQIDVSNNFIVNTNKFKVDSSGNVQIPGTLDISNNLTLNTNKFTVNSATGAIQSAGNVDISKNFTMNTNKFIVDLSGNVTSAGTLDISSNLAINTKKFIADASGNIICAGNFDISDNFSLNTNSILIDKSGNILAKGSLTGVQNFSINNNNFYIDTSSNARARGNFDLSQNLTVGGDVFKTNIYNKYVGLNTYNNNNKNILDISGNIGTSTGFFGDISNSIIMSHRDYANNTQYLVKQSYSGEITINNKSSTETIDICFDNTPQCTINSDGDMTLQGTIYTFSDIRIKENVKVIENALEKVKALQGIKYNLIHEDDTTHKKHIGLLAQDVEKVIPEAIETDGDIKTVAYNNLIGLLIQAIKELYCKYKTIKQ